MAQGDVALKPIEGGLFSTHDMAEMMQCDRLLQFRDQVLSGTHPRVKIPSNLVGKLNNSAARSTSSPKISNQPSKQSAMISSTASIPAPYSNQASRGIQNTSRPRDAEKVPSKIAGQMPASVDINPVLLEKSDDLIKAEIQLSRQRLERALRDQVEQRRIAAKAALQTSESLPDFDLSDVLSTALTLVKPSDSVEDISADAQTSASDSFDDNTFYSSQHDTPEQSPARQEPGKASDFVPDVDAGQRSRSNVQGDSSGDVSMTGVSLSNTNVGLRHVDSIQQQHTPVSAHSTSEYISGNTSPRQPSYAANIGSMAMAIPNVSESRKVASPPASHRTQAPYSPGGRQESAARRHDTSPLMQAAHDLSPVAPQPARVSPLATRGAQYLTHGLHLEEEPRHGQISQLQKASGPDSAESSPKGDKTSRRTKKKTTRKSAGKQPAISPDSPYIKPEPRSPSPFDTGRPLRPAKRQKQNSRPIPQGAEISYDEPRYEEIREIRRPEAVRHEERPLTVYDRGFEAREPLYERRDDMGRRIVSQEYVQRRPTEGYETRYIRAPSRVVGEVDTRRYRERDIGQDVVRSRSRSPGRDYQHVPMGSSRAPVPIEYEQSGRYYVPHSSHPIRGSPRAPSEVEYDPVGRFAISRPSVRSRAEVTRPDSRSPGRDYTHGSMVPSYSGPVELDQTGRFYVPRQPARALQSRKSVAPIAPPGDVEVTYERAPTRAFSTRPPEIFEEGGYVYRRATPPMVAPRRVITQLEPEAGYRVHSQEYAPRQRTVAPSGELYDPRIPAPNRRHYDDAGPGYVTRVASVHPESIRTEAPRGYRVASVRPDQYEYAGSVRPEARREMGPPQVFREYSARPGPVREPAGDYSVRPVEPEAFEYARPGPRQGEDVEYVRNGPTETYMEDARREYR